MRIKGKELKQNFFHINLPCLSHHHPPHHHPQRSLLHPRDVTLFPLLITPARDEEFTVLLYSKFEYNIIKY